MKTVTVTTSCIADVKETWTFTVADDWEQGELDDSEVIDALDEGDFEVTDEVDNERDRTVLSIKIEETP